MADGSMFPAGAPGKLKVVGFAGGGGSSVALKMATGCDPDLAMNHWLTAVLAHQRHFPGTEHHCADIFDTDPRSFRPDERIAFGWFSPDCTDFSKAKGKAPRSERIRGLAWSVIPWATCRMIDVIMLENVEEFLSWGPVHRSGPKAGEPIPERRGETFAKWRCRLEKLGYVVEWRILNAADYGAPTTRKRLYLIARYVGIIRLAEIQAGREASPIIWPPRTHAPRKDAAGLGLKPWRGACEIIDFTQDCPSLFLTPGEVDDLRERTGRKVRRPLAAATMKRVARGMERYVIGSAEPFIVPVRSHGGGGNGPRAAADPLRTVTATKRGEFAVVDAELAMLTNAYGSNTRGGRGDPAEPTKTLTSANHTAVVTASLVGLAHGEHTDRPGSRSRDIRQPIQTISASGGDAAMIAGHLVRTDMHQSNSRCAYDAGDPLRTNTSSGGHAAVAASLHQMNTRDVGAEVWDPTRAQPGREHQAIQAATLVRQFGTGVAHDVRNPDGCTTANGIKTQLVAAALTSYYSAADGTGGSVLTDPARTSTGRDRHGLIAAWLEQANTDMVGHELPAPVSTIVGKGCTQRLIEARLELDGGPIGRRAAVLEFLWSHFGVPTAEEWSDPAGTLRGRLKFGMVLLNGQVWMIVDIGLRMLTPAELAAAMGLPAEYDLTADVHGNPVSKTNQTQMIGNMVSPPPAAALIAANCPDLIEPEQRRAA